MKAGEKNKKRRISGKYENASSVCYSNSPELRPEYKDEDITKEDATSPEPKKKIPSNDSK
jgi:hypothetical protein